MKRLVQTAAVALALGMTTAQADFIGLYLGIDGWDMDSSGKFGSDNLSDQNFNLDNDTKASFFIALEHPLPLLPNIRVRGQNLDTSGQESANFELEGTQFDGEVNVEFDITDANITLYYELFDNDVVSFDLGLTGKYLNGDITVTGDAVGGTATEKLDFTGVVPLLYGALEIGIPTTGLSVFGEISGLSYDDNTIMDYQAGAAYSFVDILPVDLSIRGGYRKFSLELDDFDGVSTDWSFDGPFAGIQAHF